MYLMALTGCSEIKISSCFESAALDFNTDFATNFEQLIFHATT
jgi:hypothetical protein